MGELSAFHLILAAQPVVERTAVRLFLPDAPGSELSPGLNKALYGIAILAAIFWREQQGAPSRAELRAMLAAWAMLAVSPDREILHRRFSAAPIIANTLLNRLQNGPDAVRASLAGSSPETLFHRFGCPSPKLVVSGCVIALHQQMRGSLPNPKNKQLIALCAALLWRARALAFDPTDAPDARPTQWSGALHRARRLYAAGKASTADEDSADRWMRVLVSTALADIPVRGK
jgi:hypothetical protein